MTKLLWIDLEMTGLDVEKEVIIEAAAIVTDFEFKPLETYHSIVKQEQRYIDQMDDWNTKHHGASGLTAQIPHGKLPEVVELELLALVNKYFSAEERAVLAGNSIAQDRLFITHHFKKLSERLHYRMVDVTSWKIIFNDKYKIKYNKKNVHRALDDVNESIAELQFYLTHIKTN